MARSLLQGGHVVLLSWAFDAFPVVPVSRLSAPGRGRRRFCRQADRAGRPMSEAMKTELDWSAWEGYGQGDAYAAVPRQGGGFGRAAALCIGSRQCQKARGQAGDKGVMCPSFRITQDATHSGIPPMIR